MKVSKSVLSVIVLLLALVFGPMLQAQPLFGELRNMRYRSKEDSLAHRKADSLIDVHVAQKRPNQKKIDSLRSLSMQIFMRQTFKTIFMPGRDFVVTDSIKSTTDLTAIHKISVYAKAEIPEVVFQCRNLEELELIRCSLSALPVELNQLKKLHSVYIYHPTGKKHLKLIRNATIKKLTIRTESLNNLPRKYNQLQELTYLNLSDNELVRFPNGARKNKKLTDLSLQRNQITLAGTIKKHKHLQRLSLHENQIVHVPSSIAKFPNLKKLNLNRNRITTVHPAIGKLHKLEQISFYVNQLTSIPKGLFNLPNLVEIDLFHNQLEAIDPEFARWRKLETLYLSHNKLTELPTNLDTLKRLTGLYVWDNRIGALPPCIGKMNQLRYLRANHNYLKVFDTGILNLRDIEELDLSHNYIEDLPESVFDLPKLKILALVNNPWNDRTRNFIFRRAEQLRAKEVFVHLSE